MERNALLSCTSFAENKWYMCVPVCLQHHLMTLVFMVTMARPLPLAPCCTRSSSKSYNRSSHPDSDVIQPSLLAGVYIYRCLPGKIFLKIETTPGKILLLFHFVGKISNKCFFHSKQYSKWLKETPRMSGCCFFCFRFKSAPWFGLRLVMWHCGALKRSRRRHDGLHNPSKKGLILISWARVALGGGRYP